MRNWTVTGCGSILSPLPAPVDINDPFRALSDPTRRRILDVLAGGALPVGVLAGHFPAISRPAVSKHLRMLREGGLVREERSGRERYYSLDREAVAEALGWIKAVYERGAETGSATPVARQGARASRASRSTSRTPRGAQPSGRSARPTGSRKARGPASAESGARPDTLTKSSAKTSTKTLAKTKPEEPAPRSDSTSDPDDWQAW